MEVRDQLLRIVRNIRAEAGKMLKDAVEVGKIEEAKAKAVDAKGKAIEKELSKEAMKGLAKGGAMEWVEGIPVEDEDLQAWAEGMLELLTEGHQEICRKVKEVGIGVCSKCRWQSGCSGCDWTKAVRYYRHQETTGKFGEGYKDAPKAKAKRKAKAKEIGRAHV